MKKKHGCLRVGFSYNQKRIKADLNGEVDHEAEYDTPKTLNSIREAIRSFGHEVIDFEATSELPSQLIKNRVDLVFNIAEGIRGRNRESQVPALLELLDIPYTGSDPATLAITLDKALAKKIVRESGLNTPQFFLMTSGSEKLPKGLKFPLIIKPVAEGSSKGVLSTSVVEDENSLRKVAKLVIQKYNQGALVEEFLTGREFTVALLGEKKPKVLPPMEIVFAKQDTMKWPVYTFAHKLDPNNEIQYSAPAQIDLNLKKRLEATAKKVFITLGCRDVARVDFRLDSNGAIHFIECNPLPGLTPGWSDLCLIAESAGIEYNSLIGEIMAPAIRRYYEKLNNLSSFPTVSHLEVV
jgi:D-alanine-D-alanine ligase